MWIMWQPSGRREKSMSRIPSLQLSWLSLRELQALRVTFAKIAGTFRILMFGD
jgi:hypothetical protein